MSTENASPMTREDPLQVVTAAREALTDAMVERLTGTAANTLEIVDRLNDPDCREALGSLLDSLTELHRSGALDTLVQLLQFLHASRAALTDPMVERLAGFIEHMVNNVGTDEMAALVHDTSCALSDAAAANARQPAVASGMLATLRLLSQPETRQTLKFLLDFGARLQQRAGQRSCG